ncbi:MAG TPA: hypothetical protein V6D30_13620 [Leptolyngbyaceae cyanobacterium]
MLQLRKRLLPVPVTSYLQNQKADKDIQSREDCVVSPWQTPLPQEEYITSRVVVYFYSGGWVPIRFYRLAEAIKLHHQARLQGKEIFVFPPEADPKDFDSLPIQKICMT